MAAMTVCTPVRPPRDDSRTRARTDRVEIDARGQDDDAREADAPLEVPSRRRPRRVRDVSIHADDLRHLPAGAPHDRGPAGRTLARAHLRLSPLAGGPSRPIAFRSLTRALSPVSLVHQAMLTSKVSTGIKAQKKAVRASKATGAVAFLDNKKAAAVALAAAVAVATPAFPAKADLTSDLIAKSEANKELNDKKRAATSSANFERSRTVTDGVCSFPKNFFGCGLPPPTAASSSSLTTRTSSARAPATARCARPRPPAPSPPSSACKRTKAARGWLVPKA